MRSHSTSVGFLKSRLTSPTFLHSSKKAMPDNATSHIILLHQLRHSTMIWSFNFNKNIKTDISYVYKNSLLFLDGLGQDILNGNRVYSTNLFSLQTPKEEESICGISIVCAWSGIPNNRTQIDCSTGPTKLNPQFRTA